MSSIPEATVPSTRAYIADANLRRANGITGMVKGVMEAALTSAAAPLIPHLSNLANAALANTEIVLPPPTAELGLAGLAILVIGKGVVDVVHGVHDFVQANSQLAPQAIQAQREAFTAEQALILEAIRQSEKQNIDYSGMGGVY